MKIYAEFNAAILALEQQPQKTVFNFLTPEQVQADPSLRDPFLGQRMLPPTEHAKDPATKLSRYLEVYMAQLEANNIGDVRERRTRRSRCEEFIALIGDIYLSDVRKVHAYQYADWMVAKGLANKTIKSNISRVSGMLTKAEQRGLIDPNPFTNLKLADYGRASIPWSPFEPSEMTKIFAQDMREQERLILIVLATTGARLDEIALLEWSQVKVDFGIMFLDLRDSKRIKNIQSRRIIPIHSKVAPLLAAKGEGRVFDYPLDENSKAQNAAGKRLAPLIDNVTKDPLKVVHSLRGTFKDMLKNAGVTAEMVEQLEAGDVDLADIADKINASQVSKELNDRITGHVQADSAGQYGVGHALIPRAAAIEKLALDFLPT